MTAAPREPRIHGSRHAELGEVRRGDCPVVRDQEVAVDATEIAKLRGHPGRQFLLQPRRELPVVTASAPPFKQVPVELPKGRAPSATAAGGADLSEGVVPAPALTVWIWIEQVAVGHEVAVGVVPAPVRADEEILNGVAAARAAQPARPQRGHVLVRADLDRRLPIAEDVVGEP